MKLVVLTDIHANLPALEVVLEDITRKGYDLLVHLGDVIDIGPFPAECLDLLLEQKNTQLIMGNHDKWFSEGLPDKKPEWMSEGEFRHVHWTLEQLDSSLKSIVATWPYKLVDTFEGVQSTFLHYGLDASGKNWLPFIREPDSEDLDKLFISESSQIICYGHHHPFSDIQGQARYLNPGSLSCYQQALARYSVIEYHKSKYSVTHCAVPYEDSALARAFRERNVPDKSFICKIFFGNRFTV